jgi:chaperonin GroEL
MATRDIPGVPRTGPGKRHAPPRPRRPAVVLQPRTYRHLLRGVDRIAEAVRPTLGPLPRLVAFEGLRRTDTPEFLDDAAAIARRIIAVEPRAEDVGAMLLRQALWRMRQTAGDGGATMAVMYQSLLREGVRAIIQFDCNAMRLRAGLEKGLPAVLASLDREAAPLSGRDNLAAVALGMCQGDAAMAGLLGEIFDMVGPDGMIVVEGWNRAGLEREYIEGTYWKLSGWLSRLFVADPASKRTTFDDPALLITDFAFKEPDQLLPALDRCVKAGVQRLVIVAREMSDRVIGLLVDNNRARTIETLAVRIPKVLEMDRLAALEDIAALVGGRAFPSAAYGSLDGFRPEDLGRARRAWATDSLFGIYGGKGDPRQVRRRLAQIRTQLAAAEADHDRRDLRERLGRLHGGTVILRVGGIHETEREARKAVAERAVTGLRNAVMGGVAPGGGAALLRAQSALAGLAARDEDERMAFAVLSRALEEPLRAIARNAGLVPDVIVERARVAPDGWGLDARSGRIVDLRLAGILDAALVLRKAVETAVSGAALALTTDVIVHHRKPAESIEP